MTYNYGNKVRLDSDFIDCYDHFMDYDGELVLQRRMDSGPNRIEMFKILNMIGLKTPKFGMVAELYKDLGQQFGNVANLKKDGYDKLVEVVVYLDINAHTGDGKIKMSLEDARAQYPGHFASQFIPTAKTFASRTERLLVVGRHRWWLEYKSHDDWRSNCGDVEINECDVGWDQYTARRIHEIKAPLFAIDFVAVGRERLAIDFNISPGIKGTPAERKLAPEDMAKAIKDRVAELYSVRIF